MLAVDDGLREVLRQVGVEAGLAEIVHFEARLGGEMGGDHVKQGLASALSAPMAIFMVCVLSIIRGLDEGLVAAIR